MDDLLADVKRNLNLFRPYLDSATIKRYEDLGEDDYRRHSPRFQGDNFQKNLDLVARITDIAHDKGCTASQLALAWVMAQGVEGHGPLLSVED